MIDRRRFLQLTPLLATSAFAVEPEAGFIPLFDGVSLRGWQIVHGPESAFYVQDGAIVIHRGSNYPAWLRTTRQFENFDFRCEFYFEGWANSGILIHAPEHGEPTETGLQINIFHKREKQPTPVSMGAIFPVVPPLRADVALPKQWNQLRILMDWPLLRVWVNGVLVQDLSLEDHPDLRYRLRRGFIGIESLSYPVRFRNLRIKPLPDKEKWIHLYEKPEDLQRNWFVSRGQAKWETLGHILRADGLGYLATRQQFADFELQLYIRQSRHSNGGIYWRADRDPHKRHYEIQIHDVYGAAYPTGSLYGIVRAKYPRIEPEKWFFLQLIAKGSYCQVRVNGEKVVEYDKLTNTAPGHIHLQAHRRGYWIEYKHIRIKRL